MVNIKLFMGSITGSSPCRGELDTSTIARRVVEGDEMGTRCWGYNWATLLLGDINTETWSSRLGVGRK
jgi:hypothetical protein